MALNLRANVVPSTYGDCDRLEVALSSNFPKPFGLYDPANEHDACGVAMVATLNRDKSHKIVQQALTALRNLEHRGASGAEPDSGEIGRAHV